MNEKFNNLLRKLPKIDDLLKRKEWTELLEKYGSPYVVSHLRKAIENARKSIISGESDNVDAVVESELNHEFLCARLKPLQRVINATGIVLHTNLGRAPFSYEIIEEVSEILKGSTNLEIDLLTGDRGIRGCFIRETLARLCNAEDTLIVNNNAAGLLLIFSVFAHNRDVIISRGELIQIGGGFRIPEVIEQGSARLKEIGTTNITKIDDYRRAINFETAAILKVHLSNFLISGFTQRSSTKELSSLKTENILLIEDLGSGNFITNFNKITLPDPTPSQVLADGADLVCFSGDKLLGGPQAGIIAGRKDLISRLEKFPLMRAIRPDKIVYALLQVVLSAYENGKPELIFPWFQLKNNRTDLIKRIKKFCRKYKISLEKHRIIETTGEFGAGSMPGTPIESAALIVTNKNAEEASEKFRHATPSVIGIIQDGRFLLDFLTILPEDEPHIADILNNLSN